MIPWSPLARGLLAGNRTRGGEQLTTRAQTDAFGDSLYRPEVDFDVIDRADEVAAARGVPTAQMALAWLLHRPGVTAPIVGATKLEHLEDALAAEQLSLSDEEIDAARGAVRAARDRRSLLAPRAYGAVLSEASCARRAGCVGSRLQVRKRT